MDTNYTYLNRVFTFIMFSGISDYINDVSYDKVIDLNDQNRLNDKDVSFGITNVVRRLSFDDGSQQSEGKHTFSLHVINFFVCTCLESLCSIILCEISCHQKLIMIVLFQIFFQCLKNQSLL